MIVQDESSHEYTTVFPFKFEVVRKVRKRERESE